MMYYTYTQAFICIEFYNTELVYEMKGNFEAAG
jgi:hypothetical protein